ncbi:MAG TPA: dihydropteroate synthase [Gemmatimonadales bacterium]|nr:dihydropteroate synthase [Gemmatimonadales bacterium]
MRLTALAAHTPQAVRAALAGRGWGSQPAWFAAIGVQPLTILIEGIAEPEREALVHWGARAGADVLTGEGWALVSTAASRLAVLARPDRAPADLAALTPEIARFLMTHAEPPRRWAVAGGEIALDRPVVMGIINVTPDSFSDGGHHATTDRALARAEQLVAEGATILDVGGESTRPGAGAVSAEEEIARVVPVIAGAVKRKLGAVSVDTRKAEVARRALAAGAVIVNDVSGLSYDRDLAAVTAQEGAGLVLMHMRGTPDTMDSLATYRHVAAEVAAQLGETADRALEAGIERDRIAVDPGFGFAKDADQNLRLLDELATIAGVGYPVVVGPSRKRFLGHVTGRPVEDRDRATAVACALAWERGARIFRVHDAALTVEALKLAAAVRPNA